MKFKTTTKEIREGQPRNYIISVGYCELQSLLSYESPMAYTSGVYGWNYDVYKIDDYFICTGYRGMPKGLKNNYEITREFEQKARQIQYNYSYDEKRELLRQLQTQYINAIREYNIKG